MDGWKIDEGWVEGGTGASRWVEWVANRRWRAMAALGGWW